MNLAQEPGARQVEGLVDGVVAIAITLLILELIPSGSEGNLLRELMAMWPKVLCPPHGLFVLGILGGPSSLRVPVHNRMRRVVEAAVTQVRALGDRFMRRGRRAARSEGRLLCACHNLLKLWWAVLAGVAREWKENWTLAPPSLKGHGARLPETPIPYLS